MPDQIAPERKIMEGFHVIGKRILLKHLAFVVTLVILPWFTLIPFANGALFTVVDLDDTLKVSDVRSKTVLGIRKTIFRVLFSRQAFAGMPELLRALHQDQTVEETQEESDVIVLTNTQTTWKFTVTPFLDKHSLKFVNLQLRPTGQDGEKSTFKPKKLNEIAGQFPGREMVLIGDNQERDPEYYLNFARSHPEIPSRIYIHRMRVGEWLEGIHYYYTSFEVAYEESLVGTISEGAALEVGRAILENSSMKTILPKFGVCPYEGWYAPKTEHPDPRLNETYAKVQERVRSFCKRNSKGP